MRAFWFIPLLVFISLALALTVKLTSPSHDHNDTTLLGTRIVDINLPSLLHKTKTITRERLSQNVSVVNVFASWCAPCLAELPLLRKIAATGVPVYGLAWHDTPEKLRSWLKDHRAPYTDVAIDNEGAFGTSIGLTGVPETVIIDHKGHIAYKLAGPLTEDALNSEVLPALKRLSRAP